MARRRIGSLAAAVCLVLVGGAPARADTEMAVVYTRITGYELRTLFEKFGYSAELTTDANGDPKIRSRSQGTNFVALFYGCDKRSPRSCTKVQLNVAYEMDDKPTVDTANDWNRRKVHGRIYLDRDDDPNMDHDIIFTGGISEANIEANLSLWKTILREYKEHFNLD